jgi:hypothetical protein
VNAGTSICTENDPSAFIGAVPPTPGMTPTVFPTAIHTVFTSVAAPSSRTLR